MTNILRFHKSRPEKEKQAGKNPVIASSVNNSCDYLNVADSQDRERFPPRLIDVRNAERRAVWTLRYFGGVVCPDHRTERERNRFTHWQARQLAQAWRFLRGPHGC